MADAVQAVRRSALDGRIARNAAVTVSPMQPAARLSLRAPGDSVAALSGALGLALPQKPKTSAAAGGRSALWLGPDEWLVIDDNGADLPALLAKVSEFHSAVDVSHRNVGISVEGEGAEAVISAGCPQDISLAVFPIGACSRTILGKVEIVLMRTSETGFRVECWRSFADYAFTFLTEAARDAVV